jgi:glycine/D-amino acid oxidase-like deaminating enzyme/nitrite reductase/ring-hydroxylating ferredoxin subunit
MESIKEKMASATATQTGNLTSGYNIPLWFAEKPLLAYEKLNQPAEIDVLVIGGGIAGLTTAFCLAKEGLKVVVVEDGFIGSGETGRTTAHITCALDDRYYDLEKIFDEETARHAADSHKAAIDFIENVIGEYHIECNFKRVDGYLFLHPSDKEENLQKELEATHRAGINTEMLLSVPYIQAEKGKPCIRFGNQGQFHIMHYMKGLAQAFEELGGKIYTQSRAEDITEKGAKVNGYEVKAKHIVVATNTPVNDFVTMHTRQWPYRSYVIGAKVPKGKLPYALWWDTGDDNSKWQAKPYHYVRLEEYDEEYDVLIAGGEDHRTGQADDEDIPEEDRYLRLAAWAKEHFPDIGNIDFQWSGQVIEPIDSLAYIGRNPGDENIYIITGDSGNGITHGTLGGIIIRDIIKDVANPWIKVYNPSRVTMHTADDYLRGVGNMVAQMADWLTPENIKEVHELKPGQGGIIVSGLKKVAVYRDEASHLHTYTAFCPHMGAVLQWNGDEKTFDCPMHGSRFTCHGKLINGPAISDLKTEVKNGNGK